MPKLTTPTARWLCALLLCATPWAHTQPSDAWRTVPLVDAHFHLMAFMTPADLLARMDRHHISHTVSAGAIGSPAIGHPNLRDSNAAAAMGPRFLPAVGNAELVNAERVEGPALFTNPDSQERPKALQQIEAFLNRPPRTIGETFPNAERSSADPMRRRRVPLDGPMFQALAEIATRFDRPLPAHMEWHPESVAGLGRLLERWPGLSLVLSHCGKITKAQDIRVFLEKHPKVVRALREGLLAQLDPSVVERVAHGNARRVFKLAP